jgi:hypothetical protein
MTDTAPPSYTSPTPGFDNTFYSQQSPLNQHPQSPYHPQDPRYIAYAHRDPNYASNNHAYHDHPHDWHPPPQELPLSTPSTIPTPAQFRAHKSMYGHARGPSELSGDHPRSELDSGGELEPESPVLSGVWQGEQESIDRHVAASDTPQQMWMAPQDWGSRSTKSTALNQQRPGDWTGEVESSGFRGPQGLGVLDDASEGTDRMEGHRAERRDVGRRRRGDHHAL